MGERTRECKQRCDQLQQIAETAYELFGDDFTVPIKNGLTTADVICKWLHELAASRDVDAEVKGNV